MGIIHVPMSQDKITGRNNLWRNRIKWYLLICTSGAKVDHSLSELLLADAAVVVVVEHSEGGLHVVHLPPTSQIKSRLRKVVYTSYTYR